MSRRPKIKITITDRRGKKGCHRGHHVGEVFDFDEDRGKICPMAMHCAFPYIDILRYGGTIPGQERARPSSAAPTPTPSWCSKPRLSNNNKLVS